MGETPIRDMAYVALGYLSELEGAHSTFDTAKVTDVRGYIADLEARLAQADTAVVEFGHRMGWATGHGDTIGVMLEHFEEQAREQIEKAEKDSERLDWLLARDLRGVKGDLSERWTREAIDAARAEDPSE